MTTLARGNPTVREANGTDSDALAHLRWIWRAVERDERGDPNRFRADFATWMDEHEQTHVPYVVEVGGRPVGMAWLVVVERIPGPELWTRLSGLLQSVYVVAEHRNGGLGDLLMRQLIEGATARGLDYLSVHPSPPSFPFYRRLGFEGDGSLLFLDLAPIRG